MFLFRSPLGFRRRLDRMSEPIRRSPPLQLFDAFDKMRVFDWNAQSLGLGVL